MQPFSVTCETCRAKLKVRDPALVGQIHACPQCGAMVMIALPVVELIPTPLELAMPIEPVTTANMMEASGSFEGLDDTIASLNEQVVEAASLETLKSTASISQYVWSATIAAGVLVVAGLGVLWAMQPGDSPELANIAESPSADTDTPTRRVDPVAKAEDSTPEKVEAAKPVVEPVEPVHSIIANETVVVDDEVTMATDELPALPNLPDESPATAQIKPEELSATEVPSRLDPLALDPVDLDLLLSPRVANATPVAAEAQPVEIAAVELQSAPVSEREEIRFAPGTFVRGPTALEQRNERPLEERLMFSLADLKLRNVALGVACNQLASLSETGCTLDPHVLEMAAYRATRPISLELPSTTVGAVLERIASGLKLDIVKTGQGVSFAKPDANKSRTIDYEIADLMTGVDSTETIVKLLNQMVGTDWPAGSCVVSGNSISVRQSLATQYQVLRFFERLRLARGSLLRSRYPAELLTIEPRFAAASTTLNRNTTLTFVDYTPLPDALDYLSKSCGMVILVDWQSLADAELTVTTLVAGSVTDVPLADALDSFCESLELVWMPVDGKTLWLTTKAGATDHDWVEFYPAERLGDAATLGERLAEKLPNDVLARATFADDAVSERIIVRGDANVHRAIDNSLPN